MVCDDKNVRSFKDTTAKFLTCKSNLQSWMTKGESRRWKELQTGLIILLLRYKCAWIMLFINTDSAKDITKDDATTFVLT